MQRPEAAKVHTVFSAECNPTFDWHSIALFHSHKTSGQPGDITRLLACNDDELATYHGLSIGLPQTTFVHRNHRREFGMNYAAYNKPASVYYWTRSGQVPPGVEFVMQLDADMLINRPVWPASLGVEYGTVLSAPYNYLVGTSTGLADHFGVVNKSYMARCTPRRPQTPDAQGWGEARGQGCDSRARALPWDRRRHARLPH